MIIRKDNHFNPDYSQRNLVVNKALLR